MVFEAWLDETNRIVPFHEIPDGRDGRRKQCAALKTGKYAAGGCRRQRIFVNRNPPAMPVVPKSFSYA